MLSRFYPRTLLVRTFLLISILLAVCISIWATLITLTEHAPRARQLGQLTVSVVNLTRAALVAANPEWRMALLRDLAENEGVQIYPIEPGDVVKDLPDTPFFRDFIAATRAELGAETRFAGAVNDQPGIWVSFPLYASEEAEYWLMLPGKRAESEFPLYWLGWGCLALLLAMLVAWLIVSRITRPLRKLMEAAQAVGLGLHPEPVPENGACELARLAASFNRMSEDLKRIDAERTEVLAGISHDLRTPLARLRLESEMSIADEAARQAVASDIEQMDAIIGQFLDYARGNDEPAEPCDIGALIRQAAESVRRTADCHLTVHLDALPPLAGRRKALTRALTNLIDNARKYGGGEITITACQTNGHLWVDVMDRGPGIPPEELERLKRPFTRHNTARSNVDGTGLGLAIVERIARLHGGSLHLCPRAGGGLLARFDLPLSLSRSASPLSDDLTKSQRA